MKIKHLVAAAVAAAGIYAVVGSANAAPAPASAIALKDAAGVDTAVENVYYYRRYYRPRFFAYSYRPRYYYRRW